MKRLLLLLMRQEWLWFSQEGATSNTKENSGEVGTVRRRRRETEGRFLGETEGRFL